jgi:hypothetical protein
MANSKSDAGLVRNSARVAHVLLRDQVLTILAPLYYFSQHHRSQHHCAIAEPTGPIADAPTCGPTRAIDLQPTGIGRS